MNHGSKPKKTKRAATTSTKKTPRKPAGYGAEMRFIYTRSQPTAWTDEFDDSQQPVQYDPVVYN